VGDLGEGPGNGAAVTAKDRVARTLKAINRGLSRYADTAALRSAPASVSNAQGAYAYFGIGGNYERLASLPYEGESPGKVKIISG